jgi:hypothetical protein
MTDESIPVAHEAIRLAKQGKMSGKEMLSKLVQAKWIVPLAEVPLIENGRVQNWHPATVSKEDGSQWVVAFTLQSLASAFCDQEPGYSTYIDVDAFWVLENLPPELGIVMNFRTEDMFQWKADGVVKYKREVLGW